VIDPVFALISVAAFAYAGWELWQDRREQAAVLARIPRPRRAS
jgi:hypothetical protein